MMRPMVMVAFWSLILCPLAASGQTSMPAAATSRAAGGGSIAIHAVQGTPDGPAVGADEVTIELFRKGGKAEKIQARLDEHGVFMLEGLSISARVQPRVTVQHAGVAYTLVGKVMDPTHRTQKITVPVYETTRERPAWQVQMRHVMLHPSEKGLHATELLAVHNPDKRTYLGPEDGPEARTTMVLGLPPHVGQIRLGGEFDSCCTRVSDGRVIHTGPLRPGPSQFRVQYAIQAGKDGIARVVMSSPALVKELVVLLPGKNYSLQSEDLTDAGLLNVKGQPMRALKGRDLPAGGQVTYIVGGAAPAQGHQGDHEGHGEQESPKSAQMLAAIGGGILLILSLLVLLVPRRGKAKSPPAESQS